MESMKIINAPESRQVEEMEQVQDSSRRRFFQVAGGIAGAGLLFSACRRTPPSNTYVGSGDIGLLNYFYILNMVEAAFYTQAVLTPYYGLTVSESALLTDLRDQEIAHREFFKKLLGKSAVTAIKTDFSLVTFADRNSVLTHATVIEDMMVAACNGAIQLFSNTDYILMTAKMATVEARHAAYARDLHAANSFADTSAVDASGLDLALAPLTVMNTAMKYIETRFDTTKLPTY